METKELNELFEHIKHELGNPPIKLLRRIDWDKKFPELGDVIGKCSRKTKEIVVKVGLSQDKITVILYHEILHLLFPTRPHWWVERASFVLSKSELPNPGRYTKRYNKQDVEIESRSEIIRLTKLASKRLNIHLK